MSNMDLSWRSPDLPWHMLTWLKGETKPHTLVAIRAHVSITRYRNNIRSGSQAQTMLGHIASTMSQREVRTHLSISINRGWKKQ